MLQKHKFLVEETKNSTYILPCFNWNNFTTEFVLDAKVQNSAF